MDLLPADDDAGDLDVKPRSRFKAAAMLLSTTLVFAPVVLHADAGLLRVSEPGGPYRISVFTEPTPLRVGGGTIHVFVADRETGEPVTDAHVRIRLESHSGETAQPPEHLHRQPRGLRFSAGFKAPATGRFTTRIDVAGRSGAGSVSFHVDVEPHQPLLVTLGPALAVPPLGIGLFALHQVLVRRRTTRRGATRRIVEPEMKP